MIYYYREMTNYIFCVLVSRHLTKCGIKSGITILNNLIKITYQIPMVYQSNQWFLVKQYCSGYAVEQVNYDKNQELLADVMRILTEDCYRSSETEKKENLLKWIWISTLKNKTRWSKEKYSKIYLFIHFQLVYNVIESFSP